MNDFMVTLNIQARKINILVLKAKILGRAIFCGHSESQLDIFIENELRLNFDNYFKVKINKKER